MGVSPGTVVVSVSKNATGHHPISGWCPVIVPLGQASAEAVLVVPSERQPSMSHFPPDFFM